MLYSLLPVKVIAGKLPLAALAGMTREGEGIDLLKELVKPDRRRN